MPIPDYQTVMLPLLQLAARGDEVRLKDAVDTLAEKFQLTEEERKTLLPSGTQFKFTNRVGWARTYMTKAGLLESPRRGYFKITLRGQSVLAEAPECINAKFLRRFEEFRDFQSKNNKSENEENSEPDSQDEQSETPEEAIEYAYERIRNALRAEMLEKVLENSPMFFEQLVVDVLVSMGYGGSRKDAGATLGKSGDGGIDGIIKEDKLGLDVIYLQAKRWRDGPVGRPEIQKFVGALQGKRAKKGVFITTSSFTKDAVEYADYLESKVILIDGQRLADLMIDHDVGVSTVSHYEVKRVDTDYFSED